MKERDKIVKKAGPVLLAWAHEVAMRGASPQAAEAPAAPSNHEMPMAPAASAGLTSSPAPRRTDEANSTRRNMKAT